MINRKSLLLIFILFVILINIEFIRLDKKKSTYSSNPTDLEAENPKIASVTDITFSTSPLSPTSIKIDSYYENDQGVPVYIEASLKDDEVYIIYKSHFGGVIYLYKDSGFSDEIESTEDEYIVIAPDKSKTFYIKWELDYSGEKNFGVFKAEQYTEDEIGEGVSLEFNNDDWGYCFVYFTMPDTSGCTSANDIKVESPDAFEEWKQINLESGDAYQENEMIGHGDEVEEEMFENPGEGFVLLAEEEGKFQITVPVPFNWAFAGIIIFVIIVFSIIGIAGFSYAREHRDTTTSRKKKIEKEKEPSAKNFENLIRKSKDLVNKGKQYYSKGSFITAINNWKDAIINYDFALKKTPSSKEKLRIKENIRILRGDICNAYMENGKKHDNNAKKAHKEENIKKSREEWNFAKKSFQTAINQIKSEKLDIEYKPLEIKINSIELNLKQVVIEELCLRADKNLERAHSLQDKELSEAVNLTNSSFSQYSEAKEEAQKYPQFQGLARTIRDKMINTRNFQSELQDKMDELIGITSLTPKVIIDEDTGEVYYDNVETIVKAKKRLKALSIKREYELIGGQIRFKVGLKNNTKNPLTNFKITFDIPYALKWTLHEPKKYERSGDSILISKIGINEKKTVSLYLEPINCMKSPINATVSFFDAKDRLQAAIMEPKMISITCPLFFTKEEANFARVKRLLRKLNHHDKKVFPIVNSEKISLMFSTALSVLGKYDILLISQEFSEKDKFGEAWFYGTTKIKRNRIITYILLDGENKILEIEVSADDEGQITAFLAEIGNKIRDELLKYNIINSEEEFYDINTLIHLNHCPYCYSLIPTDLVQKYINGEPIKCKYCDEGLTLKERY